MPLRRYSREMAVVRIGVATFAGRHNICILFMNECWLAGFCVAQAFRLGNQVVARLLRSPGL